MLINYIFWLMSTFVIIILYVLTIFNTRCAIINLKSQKTASPLLIVPTLLILLMHAIISGLSSNKLKIILEPNKYYYYSISILIILDILLIIISISLKRKIAQQGDAPEPDSSRMCLPETKSRPGDL